MNAKQLKQAQDEFVNWCFSHMDGTESKLELGLTIWIHQAKEIHRLAQTIARLEREMARPTPTKKRTK